MAISQVEKQEIFNRAVKVIEKILHLDREKDFKKSTKIDGDCSFSVDLGVDSLEFMDLLAAIDREFKICMKVEKAVTKKTVNDLVAYITELIENIHD